MWFPPNEISIPAAPEVPPAAAPPVLGALPGLESLLARFDVPMKIPGILTSDAPHPIGATLEQHAMMLDRALLGNLGIEIFISADKDSTLANLRCKFENQKSAAKT